MKLNFTCKIEKRKAFITNIEPYKHPKPNVTEIPVYDFTVDTTHSYCVGSVLVSNSKHFGDMEFQSLLSHGVTDVIKDTKLIKGQKNTDFWRQLKLGQTPVMPTTPFVYEKFKDLIRSGGVTLTEGKNSDNIFAMTDNDAKRLTGNRKIQNSATFSAISLKPIAGGLFDPDATGSLLDGNRFAYIPLTEPMLNPVMETPIRTLLGITQKEFGDIVAGRTPVEGKVGGEALRTMLDKIDLKGLVKKSIEEVKAGSPSKRDKAIRTIGYATAMLNNKVIPSDFLMSRIPVLPPKYRPISRQGALTMVADMNYMYKELMSSMDDFADTKDLPELIQQEARHKMYEDYKSLVGLTDPSKAELKTKQIGGILQQLFSSGSPKSSFVQRKLLGTNIDISGLAVITPNPSLKLNEVGLPEKKAWDLYEPFVIRELVLKGVPATAAATAVQDRTKMAYRVLQDVVKQRPVMINRAPTLHKYSIMAFWPVLTKGNTLQTNPSAISCRNERRHCSHADAGSDP